MHTDPEGTQVLMLFGLDRIQRVAPSDLTSVEEQLREYEDLSRR